MENKCLICRNFESKPIAQCQKCKTITCGVCITTYNLGHKYNLFECTSCCLIGLNPASIVTEVLSDFTVARPTNRNKDKLVLPLNNPEKIISNHITPKSNENTHDIRKKSSDLELKEIFSNNDSNSIGIDDQLSGNLKENIEIRCIKLDHRGKNILGEQTWPDYFELHFNRKQTLLTCMPIDYNTSIKKRRDDVFSMSNGKLISLLKETKDLSDFNGFWVSYSNTLDNKNSFSKDANIISYMFVIVKTQLIDYNEFEKSSAVRVLSDQQSLNYINVLFDASLFSNLSIQVSDIMDAIELGLNGYSMPKIEEDIVVEGLKLDTVDNLSYTKLETPGRGNKCYHLSCFSLKNIFGSIKNSKHKKIYCPICGNAIQYFYYDKLIE